MTGVRWLALLPVLGILVGTAFVNQVEPLVFGLPLVLAWIVGWVVVGAALMAIVYALDPINAETRVRPRRRPAMNGALVIIGLTAVMALGLGLAARRGLRMTLEQWTVAERAFGGPFVFLLTAGEIYTTFTFLGGSGYAYGKGAPAYYILAYGTLAYILSYWLLPPIWRYAKQERLISQSHFFAKKYDSPGLGILAAVVGVVALVPYLVLQLKGLGIIVSVASYGSISPSARGLDRRRDGHDLRHDLRRARHGVERGGEGLSHSRGRGVSRDLSAAALLRRLRRNVPRHRRRQAGIPDVQTDRRKRAVVPIDGGADRVGLLHVAARLRRRAHLPARAHLPSQCGDPAALSADPAVRLLLRLRGDPQGSRPDRRRHRPVAVQAGDPDLRSVVRRRHRRGGRADGARAGLDDPSLGGDAPRQRRAARAHARSSRTTG